MIGGKQLMQEVQTVVETLKEKHQREEARQLWNCYAGWSNGNTKGHRFLGLCRRYDINPKQVLLAIEDSKRLAQRINELLASGKRCIDPLNDLPPLPYEYDSAVLVIDHGQEE